jgi:hypothetical protein
MSTESRDFIIKRSFCTEKSIERFYELSWLISKAFLFHITQSRNVDNMCAWNWIFKTKFHKNK